MTQDNTPTPRESAEVPDDSWKGDPLRVIDWFAQVLGGCRTEHLRPKAKESLIKITDEILDYRQAFTQSEEHKRLELCDKLCAFVLQMMQDTAWDGGDLDGADAQEFGEEYGVLIPATVTQDQLDNGEVDCCLEPGDTAYFLTPLITAGAKRYEQKQEEE